MVGHFLDIKQAYIIGMLKALQDYDPNRGVPFIAYKEYAAMREVHEYIRTMRTGFTVQSNDEYLRLRKAMRLFRGSRQKWRLMWQKTVSLRLTFLRNPL